MEHSFIAWAKQRASRLPKVKLGIGDDCALLDHLEIDTQTFDQVVTTDSLCDGTHFILAECGGFAAGKKLIAVSLSDLASMGAEPVAVFLSLCLPKGTLDLPNENAGDLAAQVFEGVLELASKHKVAIAGGDTNVWNGPLCLNLTAIGKVPRGQAWLRSGAEIGDSIVVTGSLGGSILGKHLEFEPRLELAKKLRAFDCITACTDISDGLGIDLLNITVASKCGAEVDLNSIPISQAATQLAESSGRSPIDHALGDGEDFELLLALPFAKWDTLPKEIDGVPLTRIGTIVSRTGLWSKVKKGVRQLPARGYVHS